MGPVVSRDEFLRQLATGLRHIAGNNRTESELPREHNPKPIRYAQNCQLSGYGGPCPLLV